MSKRYEIWQMIAEKELESVWPQWKIVRILGHGAYGDVYEIQREDYGKIYRSALKIIHIDDPSARTGILLGEENKVNAVCASIACDYPKSDPYSNDFQTADLSKIISNEIGIMEQLKGVPNIVVIEDHAVLHDDGEYSILIRMELLENLKDYITRKGALSVNDVLKIGIDICQALTYCEKRNIVHRDIKEENLYVSSFGDFKIGDFGISKAFDKLQGRDNQTSVGTISYAAPEIYNGEKYDSTIDIYSLGIVLYTHLNHGRLPFCPSFPQPVTSEDISRANRMRMQKKRPPLPSQVPEELGHIICRACSPIPQERYQSASAFKAALEDYKNKLTSLRTDYFRHSNENKADDKKSDSNKPDNKKDNHKRKLFIPFTVVICAFFIAYLISTSYFRESEVVEGGVETFVDNNLKEADESTHVHKWKAATYDEPKTCEICGKREGFVKGYVKGDELNQGAFSDESVEINDCTVCPWAFENQLKKCRMIKVGISVIPGIGDPLGKYNCYVRSNGKWKKVGLAIDIELTNKEYTNNYRIYPSLDIDAIVFVPQNSFDDQDEVQWETMYHFYNAQVE